MMYDCTLAIETQGALQNAKLNGSTYPADTSKDRQFVCSRYLALTDTLSLSLSLF